MMKQYKIMMMTAAAVVLTAMPSCSGDEASEAVTPQQEIQFTSSIVGQELTRSTGDYSAFDINQVFYVWADQITEDDQQNITAVEEYIPAWKLTTRKATAANPSQFTYSMSRVFPTYNALSFYALHGNLTIEQGASSVPIVDNTSKWDEISLAHTVLASQTSDSEIQQSDLIYAVKPLQKPQGDAVALEFYHLLSKVEVAIKHGNSLSDNQIKNGVTVRLTGTKRKVAFDMTNAKAAELDLTTLETANHGRKTLLGTAADATDTDGASAPITMATVTTTDFTTANYASAIVVPQTVDGAFIELEYLGHTTTYSVTNLELKSGYRYRFNIIVDRIGDTYTLTPTIEDWNAENVSKYVE